MPNYIHGGNVWADGAPEQWIDFSANLNPKGIPEVMINSIKNNLDKIVYYPEVDMELPSLNIASYLGVPSEQILPTSGGIGALSLISEGLVSPKIAILQPGFVEYLRLAKNKKSEVVHIPIINEQGKVFYPEDKIINALDEKTMLFICNPSNPIGTTIPRDSMLSIIDCAQQKGATVVVDEAFIEYSQEDSVKDLVEKYPCLVIAGSLTKIFAIPGIRLGYICANANLIEELKQRQTPWSLSSFACDVTNVLGSTKEYVEDSIKENKIQRQFLTYELESLGVSVFDSKANFLLCDLRQKKIKTEELQKSLLKHKILIRNCSNYIFLDDYYTRIAVKSKEDNEYLIYYMKKYLGK
ncbi:aminotransferase class I/II-fold pyridoxal phosphate-dependent enzyme [Alkalibaculum sp. M08DMB]|uniref:Aminotransferase n=1 Tax=Alkalibaculum sporogenes TaxID=2655001 RepID=A0A6A7KAB1_9FIRM|nr:histidinol-phosphate transaminase [Alkalibaculum sporogenes]MPW26292.1 aminotransferase class I/II-fold pyridoxal phosphate-dependent enzyme [Alkalibaculum sporogenes]